MHDGRCGELISILTQTGLYSSRLQHLHLFVRLCQPGCLFMADAGLWAGPVHAPSSVGGGEPPSKSPTCLLDNEASIHLHAEQIHPFIFVRQPPPLLLLVLQQIKASPSTPPNDLMSLLEGTL